MLWLTRGRDACIVSKPNGRDMDNPAGRNQMKEDRVMPVLTIQHVNYVYQTQYQKVEALKDISADFEAGKVYAIIGKSGSGKTTLLSLMAGLDLPTQGEILCHDVATSQMQLEQYRREKVAVIYQNFRLFPLLTVAENVMYPMELRGMKPKEAQEKAF